MSSERSDAPPQISRRNRKRLGIWLGISALFILLTAASLYFYTAYQKAIANNPNEAKRKVVEQVDKLVELPDEEPAIATVHDDEKLASEALAQKTKTGDKLLIYGKSKKIVVFRPATGKVVDILTIQDKKRSTQ